MLFLIKKKILYKAQEAAKRTGIKVINNLILNFFNYSIVTIIINEMKIEMS